MVIIGEMIQIFFSDKEISPAGTVSTENFQNTLSAFKFLALNTHAPSLMVGVAIPKVDDCLSRM